MKENSIEEDIKIIEYNMKCIRNVMNNFEDKLCENMQIKTDEVSKIIYNILSDYKRVLKENESLQKTYDDCYCKYKHYKQFESISVQKVKDKIEEIQEEGYWLFTTDRDSDKCVEVLQELLESEK